MINKVVKMASYWHDDGYSNSQRPAIEDEYNFKLNSIVCHAGATSRQGHYTSLCLNEIDKHWRFFDDRTVLDYGINLDIDRFFQSSSMKPYILFYTRINGILNYHFLIVSVPN